jgi:rhodanese-related sulfurtransferase
VNVPVDQVGAQLSSWDKTAPIAVYYATGSRSVGAVSELAAAGFTDIYHFNNGIVTWTGDLDTGSAVAAAPVAAEPSASGLPVMYEFFTDW